MEDTFVIASHQNAGASEPLRLALRLECNTGSEAIAENIRINSARDELPWLRMEEVHDGVAVIVGGGPSLADTVSYVRALKNWGGTIIALNGASGWLRKRGIRPDFQCIIDARPENMDLLDREAPAHLLASQAAPCVVSAVPNVTLVHLSSDGLESQLPAERMVKGDYCLVGGGYGVGNTAICAAYVLGFRTLHCFGFDSSHRKGRGHAYPQPMNDGIPCVETVWDGVTYTSSLPMKAHAERFQIIANDLRQMGCRVHVHGDGLLPAMFNNPHPLRKETR